MLLKLENYGTKGRLYTWIQSFLFNRIQCVTVCNKYSTASCIVSSFLYESVLGPLLFSLFINDIESVCLNDTELKLFADDCKLYAETILNCSSESLQQSLNSSCNWAHSWHLKINIDKTFIVSVAWNQNSVIDDVYYINDLSLNNDSIVNDFGILTSFELATMDLVCLRNAYNSIAWSTTEVYLIDLIEGVQCFFC